MLTYLSSGFEVDEVEHEWAFSKVSLTGDVSPLLQSLGLMAPASLSSGILLSSSYGADHDRTRLIISTFATCYTLSMASPICFNRLWRAYPVHPCCAVGTGVCSFVVAFLPLCRRSSDSQMARRPLLFSFVAGCVDDHFRTTFQKQLLVPPFWDEH